MSAFYMGQIIQGGWNYAPRGFAFCQGQLLSIAQNNALFALLGTTFGGNGTTTFQLPNLAGRVMVGSGQAPGLSPYVLGEVGGTENTTLIINNMPMHNHQATFVPGTSTVTVADAPGTTQQAVAPSGSILARSIDGAPSGTAKPQIYAPANTTPTALLNGVNVAGTVTVGTSGGNVPFSILQPFTCVSTVIALEGVFPSRN